MMKTSWLQYKKSIQHCLGTVYGKSWNIAKDYPLYLGGVAISFIVILFGISIYLWNLAPVDFKSKERQVLEIDYGSSLREISGVLEARGIIRNRAVFEWYVRLNPKQRMAKAGNYMIGPGLSVPRIINILKRGTSQDMQVTIPEGLTNQEIATLLAAKGLVKKEAFLEKLQDTQFIADILEDIPFDGSAEGYLYPDTYRFSLGATDAQIIEIMVKRFSQVFQEHLHELPKNRLKEVLIIASIVEEEAKKAEERPLIAGVFYNRLRKGYPLQSCATVQYALGSHKKRLYYQDLEISSPYNTYKHQGLPPGPIANPGLASLYAAAYPAKVSYLYFVAKPDGSHMFSNTYEQHLRAQRSIGNLNF